MPAVVAPIVPTEQPKEEVQKVVTPPAEKVDSVVAVADTPKEVLVADTVVVAPTEEAVVTEQPKEEVKTPFPVIYFSFNSVWIEPDEKAKIKEIADLMKAHPDMRIRITGWGDNVGGEEVNKRVSLQRAEAVKRMLGKWLIPAERVETVGAGINHNAANNDEARSATTIEIAE